MTKAAIVCLLKNYRQYETEVEIATKCSRDNTKSLSLGNGGYVIAQKRLTLMDSWMAYLSEAEASVVRLHLIEGVPWSAMTVLVRNEQRKGLPYDPRTLQRTKKRAIDRIERLMNTFQGEFDYLEADSE